MLPKSKVTVPPEERIPLVQKLAFSTGESVQYLATIMTVSTLYYPFFNKGLGISPTVIGIILMALRVWDAFTDPLMGNLSDNTRSRWGRRRPYMILGGLLLAVLYPVIWLPPESLGQAAIIAHMVITGIAIFSAYTIFSMPYYGLQMELTPNFHERTNITAWMAITGKFVGLAGSQLMRIVTSDRFADPITGEPNIVAGMQAVSYFVAGFILICALLPAFFVKEKFKSNEKLAKNKESFIQSVKNTWDCRPMWYLIGGSFGIVVGWLCQQSLGNYLVTYYVFDGDWAAASHFRGNMAFISFGLGLGSVPLLTWAGKYVDKKVMVGGLILSACLGQLLTIVCMNPDYPYLLVIPAILEGTPLAAVWLFLPSMKADVADFDEIHTEKRREGALNAFYSWFIKAAFTVAVGLSGFLLDFSGFDVVFNQQPADILYRMKVIYIASPFPFWALALYCIFLYPITKKKFDELRAELENRRGKLL